MKKVIRILFQAEGKDSEIEAPNNLDYAGLIELANREKIRLESVLAPSFSGFVPELKVFVKIQVAGQKYFKYLKLQNQEEVAQVIRNPNSSLITIEFFHCKKEETIRRTIIKIGETLEQREKELRNLTNQLKDEANQMDAINLIRKNTRYSQSQTIEVLLVVCDPLVETELDTEGTITQFPLYHDEIDLPSHIERLKKASLSNGNFRIKVQRIWGTKDILYNVLKHGTEADKEKKMFTIIQIFTRVEKRQNGVLMMSIQGQTQKDIGQRVWLQAADFFNQEIYANIIVIIGVGVNLLSQLAKEVNFSKPLILISTISLQDKRIITTSWDRSLIDIENSYNDRYCQVFLQSFYYNLFRRYEVRTCYQMAIKDISEPEIKQNLWCCCLHVHHQSCQWRNIVRRIGELETHRLLKHQSHLSQSLNMYRKRLQDLLLGGKEPISCATVEKLCCFNKVSTKTSKNFHTAIDKFIIWNERQPDEVYSSLEPEQQRPNRFESQVYDKPTGRKRPLTVYRVVKHIVKNDICIIRSSIISQAKRYFGFAKQYLQARNPCLFCHQFQTASLHDVSAFRDIAINLILNRSNVRLGASIKSRKKQWLFFMQYKFDNHSFFQNILKRFMELKVFYKREVKLKLVLLTDDISLSNKKIIGMLSSKSNKNIKELDQLIIEEPFDIADADPLEKYHSILSRHCSSYVQQNLEKIAQNIMFGEVVNEKQDQSYLQELKKDQDAYRFLGFLSQFSEDGFYLNKISNIILTKLFSKQVIYDALQGKLPVEHIDFPHFDSIYLQLHKAFRNHFKSPDNIQKLYFQQKRLEYYYLLMRLYFEYWPQEDIVNYPSVIRNLINKQGIFSIDIEKQRNQYQRVVAECKKEIGHNSNQVKAMLFDITNPIHVFHLTQVQKILQQFMKKKKNKHNPTTSKSFLDQTQFKRFQYLVWNIILKSWLMSQVLYKQYEENVKRFQMVLLIFFVQAEMMLPISEVGRIQMHVLMNKCPPKLEDNDFGNMTAFLRLYRNYAYRSMTLFNMQSKWGQHHKCKQLLDNCTCLAAKIGEMVDSSNDSDKQQNDFKDYIRMKHKMFNGTNVSKWIHECLKLKQKKVLYHFNFTKEMKNNQNSEEFRQKISTFQKHFKLSEIEYELEGFKKKVPAEMLKEHETVLIDHYLKVKLQEEEVDQTKLTEFKGKISADYLPIFSYLCQKVQKKALFNQTGLIIFSRARTLIYDRKPYFYTRRRTLLTQYLGKVFRDRELKISYFPLTQKLFNLFEISQHNYKCEVICMILTIDSTSQNELMFGSQLGVDTVKMSYKQFAQKIRKCRIKILILCGKNSTQVCSKLKEYVQSETQNPMAHSQYQGSPYSSHFSAIRPVPSAVSAIRCPATSTIYTGMQQSDKTNIKESGSSNNSRSRGPASGIHSKFKMNTFPTVIAIQSEHFSLNDVEINQYSPKQSMVMTEKSIVKSNRPSLAKFDFSKVVQSKEQEQEQITENKMQLNIDLIKVEQQTKAPKHKIEEPKKEQELDIDQIIKKTLEQQSQIHSEKHQPMSKVGRGEFKIKIKRAESENSEPLIILKSQVEKYLANQVNQIFMDLMVLSIIKKIVNKASIKDTKFKEIELEEIVSKSKEDASHILKSRFECVQFVEDNITFSIWTNNNLIFKVPDGQYDDLTKKFYCIQNNLRDQNYYENIGHCLELNQIFQALTVGRVNCIEIFGGLRSQKQNLLQQTCWYALTKSLFKFGVFKVDLKDGNLSQITGRTFKNRETPHKETGVLIALESVDQYLKKYKEDLLQLKGKSFTIIYTTCNKEVGEELRQILSLSEYLRIDLNSRDLSEVNNYIYAHLLSHIKQKKQFRLSSEMLMSYQIKIDQIMKAIQSFETEDKLLKAQELLRGFGAKQDNQGIYYNFYKQPFQELVASLKQIKEIVIKII